MQRSGVQISPEALNQRFKSSYLDKLNREGLSQRRKKKIVGTLNIIGRMNLLEPTQENIEKYFNWLKDSDYTYSTQRTNWFIYTRYMKWLNKELDFNYKLKATVKKELPRILSLEEIQRMISSTENSRDRAVLCLLFDSGMRPSELTNLKIEDVIFDEEGLLVSIPVEGKRGQRRIRIVNTVKSEEALKEWLKYHKFKSDPYSPLFYRLDRRTKDNLSIESLNKFVKKTCIKAGINRNINSYTFRHSRATHLSKFMTEQEMKVYFGWTMGSDMVQVYVHLSCRDLDEKVLELNKKPLKKKEEKEDIREMIREELLRVLREV